MIHLTFTSNAGLITAIIHLWRIGMSATDIWTAATKADSISWLGDDKLPLMDVDTENKHVIDTLQAWIKDYVKEFSIDGLRIDGELP